MGTLIKDVFFTASKDSNMLAMLVEQAVVSGAGSLMILVCDNNALTSQLANPILQALSVPVCGGVFPVILHNDKYYEEGYLVCAFHQTLDIHLIEEIESTIDVESLSSLSSDHHEGLQSMVVLLDGLNPYIDGFINALYHHIGTGVNVLGGGAGSLSFNQKPCILTNKGLLMNCAQLIQLPTPLSIGIRHGWEILAGPFMVTESKENIIKSLNFKPAYDVYKDTVSPYTYLDFSQHDFFDIAKTFPFGMERLDGEVLVRDPIIASEEGLVCVGKVPMNTMVYILKGEATKLIDAAANAVISKNTNISSQSDSFIFDCISRKLFLEERFIEELKAVHQRTPEGGNLVGALSLGEIANSGGGIIQFHNKTIVIGISA